IAEEIAKALGVLLIFWLLRAEFDNMRDGIVYGALVGLGFNWFEAALYVAQGYAENGVAPYGAQLGGRYALLGLRGHPLFPRNFRPIPWTRYPDPAQVGPNPRPDRRARPCHRGPHVEQRPAASFHARRRRRGRAAARARASARHRVSRCIHQRHADAAHHLP